MVRNHGFGAKMPGHTASTPLVAFGHTAKVAQNGKFLFFLFKFLEVSENQIWHRKLACVVRGRSLLAALQAASRSRDFEPIPALANVDENGSTSSKWFESTAHSI